MNKLLLTAIVAAGLATGVVPAASAHPELRGAHVGHTYSVRERHVPGRYYYHHKRAHRMPKWLKHKKSFRRWYRDSPIARYRFLTWHQLYDIYRWERSYFRYHRH